MTILYSGWHFHFDWEPLIVGVIILLVLAYCMFFPLLIAKAAKNKGRSGFLWFFFSLFISPLLAILLLLVLGDTDARRREKAYEAEHIRNTVHGNTVPKYNYEDNKELQQLLEQSRRS